MARTVDLMGLGMSPFLAGRLGEDVVFITCAGATAGAATQVGPSQSAIIVNASNSGSGIKLPNVGGDPGCLIGDEFTVTNFLGQSIYVYAVNNSNGSAVVFVGAGVSTAGTTGISVATGWNIVFQAVAASIWTFQRASA